MSNLQGHHGRVSDTGGGDACQLTIPTGQDAHACPVQPTATEQGGSCPYADKTATNANPARVMLMLVRDFVEQQQGVYASQAYFCPMVRCYQQFADPMSLIQHVLSCPELPGGMFQCWKCLNWHELPSDEKEWSDFGVWKPDAPQGPGFPPKRSLSQQIKDAVMRRRNSIRKVVPGSPTKQEMDVDFQIDTRLNPELTGVLNNLAFRSSVCQDIEVEQQHRGGVPGFHDPQKEIKPSQVDVDMIWQDLSTNGICGMPATTQTTGFDHVQSPTQPTPALVPGLSHSQCHSPLDDRTMMRSPVQLVSPPPAFNSWPQVQSAPFDCYPASPPLAMSNTLIVDGLSVAPQMPTQVSVAAPPPMDEKSPSWLGPRTGPDLARLSPVSWVGNVANDSSSERSTRAHSIRDSGSLGIPPNNYNMFGVQSIQAPTPRAIPSLPMSGVITMTPDMSTANSSQETIQLSRVNRPFAAPPLPPAPPQDMVLDDVDDSRPCSPTPSEDDHGHDDGSDDLVCDQCQWRPRGVKENLKGYLRKHKNVHKGLRLPCDYPGCKKTFSRLDNLKKHRREKHGLDETGNTHHAAKRAQEDCGHTHGHHMHHHEEHISTTMAVDAPPPPPPPQNPRDSSEYTRGVYDGHSVLWPGLHL
ncbi:hypothetical protein GQ53DRAFT_775157 [Thozetella sp. PMI_491]|nr:hypothetical protein GQ53DRAFT_775157 [Thozetella sp. PMI_491]